MLCSACMDDCHWSLLYAAMTLVLNVHHAPISMGPKSQRQGVHLFGLGMPPAFQQHWSFYVSFHLSEIHVNLNDLAICNNKKGDRHPKELWQQWIIIY